jgi:hypothetical protein
MNLQTVISETFAHTFFASLLAAVREALQQNGMDPCECEMYDIDDNTAGIRYRGSLMLKIHKPDIKILPSGIGDACTDHYNNALTPCATYAYPSPLPKQALPMIRHSFHISPVTLKKLKTKAKKQGISTAEYLRRIIDAELK